MSLSFVLAASMALRITRIFSSEDRLAQRWNLQGGLFELNSSSEAV
jgi:hypothetical protein